MRMPRISAGASSMNRISVGLTKTPFVASASARSDVLSEKPTPRTLTTVPAGHTPSPGTTSVIATVPPTLTVPGAIFDGEIKPSDA